MARILIVDDDKDLLFLIGEYLRAYGFVTELASSVVQARDFLEISHFDAIVSDFSMPGESGLDLLDHVSFMYPGLPFIMMTGYRMTRLRKQAMKKGCSGFLLKPFEFKELLGAIEKAMGFPDRRDSKLALTA
jgi:DNA-binding NtrC family response regulator